MKTGRRFRTLLAAVLIVTWLSAPLQAEEDVLRIDAVDHDTRTLVIRGEALRVPDGVRITLETATGIRRPIGFRDLARRQYVRLEIRAGQITAITVIESAVSGEGML